MVQRFFFGFMFIAAVLLNGCVIQPVNAPAQQSVAPVVGDGTPSPGNMNVGAYVLKPFDPIYIRFSGVVDQQQLEVVIDENGEISLLHLDSPVKAAGLTTSVLEDRIESLYQTGGIYKHVSVNVTMTAKIYYVQGEVNAPGLVQLTSGTTLIQAIAAARGYTPFANKKKVTVTRYGKIYTYNMKDVEKDPSKDVKIEAGDVIKVWQSPF